MTRIGPRIAGATLAAIMSLVWGAAHAQTLTVDRAVELALRNSTEARNAEAGLDDARGGLYGAYSGVLPSLSGTASRGGNWQKKNAGTQVFGTVVFPTDRSDQETFSTRPSLSASWSVLNLSSLSGLSAARTALKAAKLSRDASRNDIVFNTRQQFYEVVKSIKLAEVSSGALRLSRDDERRVRALFEVGSVSRADLLKAQVATAQSELDSLTSYQNVTVQRIVLATVLGIAETEMGQVDTVLTTEAQDYDESELLAEAERNRPDLKAAEAQLSSAKANVQAAAWPRLPYLTLSAGATYQPTTSFKVTTYDTNGVALPSPLETSGRNESDLWYSASIALNWNIFDGLATDGRIAGARAQRIRAEAAYDRLRRNLESGVRQTLLTYRQTIESQRVAARALAFATENLKLTQQKYNVGSSTILDLIDAQVQLQRAQSDAVTALASIRVAEAAIERVRGGR